MIIFKCIADFMFRFLCTVFMFYKRQLKNNCIYLLTKLLDGDLGRRLRIGKLQKAVFVEHHPAAISESDLQKEPLKVFDKIFFL